MPKLNTPKTVNGWIGIFMAVLIITSVKEYIFNCARFWGISDSNTMFTFSALLLSYIIYRTVVTNKEALQLQQKCAEAEELGHA